MDFPRAHWLQIHSTNPLERQNAQIKRRTDVVGICPASAVCRAAPRPACISALPGCGPAPRAGTRSWVDAIEADVDGVGVPAEPAPGLVQRDAGGGREVPGRGESRDAGADDGDAAHRSGPGQQERGTVAGAP